MARTSDGGALVVDVKSFYMDPPEEVAERIALCAK